jgi:hypothetical protein
MPLLRSVFGGVPALTYVNPLQDGLRSSTLNEDEPPLPSLPLDRSQRLWRDAIDHAIDIFKELKISIFKELNKCARSIPRRETPGLCMNCPSKDRGRRESRVRAAPAVSRAKCI